MKALPIEKCFPPRLPQASIALFRHWKKNKNCIDLNRIFLAVEICIHQPDGSDKLKLADVELTFANNTLRSPFSHVDLFLNSILICSNNNNYNRLAFIETDFTTDTGSKLTWALCQGYRYRAKAKSSQEVKRKAVTEFRKCDQFKLELNGAPQIKFFNCERLQIPGVKLHLRFYRFPNYCAIESEHLVSCRF